MKLKLGALAALLTCLGLTLSGCSEPTPSLVSLGVDDPNSIGESFTIEVYAQGKFLDDLSAVPSLDGSISQRVGVPLPNTPGGTGCVLLKGTQLGYHFRLPGSTDDYKNPVVFIVKADKGQLVSFLPSEINTSSPTPTNQCP